MLAAESSSKQNAKEQIKASEEVSSMGEKKTEIDIHFDFTTDKRGYWEKLWDNNNGMGASKRDQET